MPKTLTKEQEALIAPWIEKWRKIALDTSRFTQEEAESIMGDFYQKVFGQKCPPVHIFDNPIQAWNYICSENGSNEEFVQPYLDGSFSSASYALFSFFVDNKIEQVEEKVEQEYRLWEATSKLGFVWPFSDACIISQKPTKILVDSNNNFHCDDGFAVEFAGEPSIKMAFMQGVSVPDYLVTTPADELDPHLYLKERSADVKAQFLRKMGVNRMMALGKEVDSYEKYSEQEHPWYHKSEYKLIDMNVLFEGDYQPYLKMKNQTTGIWHFEAVDPSCITIPDALKYRFGGREFEIVTIK